MGISSSDENPTKLHSILERLLSDAEFREQFEKDRNAVLMSLNLSGTEYSALLHLDVGRFLQSAQSITVLLTACQ